MTETPFPAADANSMRASLEAKHGLVDAPDAQEFLATSDTMLNAKLGRPADYDGKVKNAITAAHEAVKATIATVMKLGKDDTDMPPVLHDKARKVATHNAAIIENARAEIESVAAELHAEATEELATSFQFNPNSQGHMPEVRADIREMALAGKIVDIRLAMNEDYDYACAIIHTPARLLKIDKDVLAKMQEDLAKRYYPGADAKIDGAIALRKLAAKYTPFAQRMMRSSFSSAVADKMRNRVEV